jgi:hypothetical protein
MEESIICPKCQTKNPKTTGYCLNCGYSFEPSDFDNTSSESSENWLDSLRKTGELKESNSKLEEGEIDFNGKESDSDSIPDWLKRIQEFSDTDNEIQTQDSTESPSKENDDEVVTAKEPGHKDKEVDYRWLDDFRNTSELQDKLESEDQSLSSEQINIEEGDSQQPLLSINEIKEDWQKEFPSLTENSDDEEISPAEDLPDWLKSDLNDTDASEEIPDKSSPSSLSSQPEELSDIEEPPEEPNELPTWLSNREEHQIEDLEKNAKKDTSIPRWLQDINTSEKTFNSINGREESSEELEDNENVLDSELLFNKLEIKIEPDTKNIEDEKSDLFLHDSEEQPAEHKLESTSPAFIFSENDQISEKPFLDNEDSSLWELKEFNNENQKEAFQNELFGKTDEEETGSQTPNSPFTFDDIPEWLDKVDLNYSEINPEVLSGTEDEQTEEITEPETTTSDEISKANLPEWLKAIRPIEVVTPDVSKIKSSKKIENTGPLAGFRGVLSTENVTDAYTPPPSYSVNVNISDKQRLHIKLLEEIISPTNIEKSKTHDKKTSSLLSIFIPVVFLAIMIFSLFLESKTLNVPVNFPAETVRFHNLITGYLNQNQDSGNILLITEVDSSAYPEVNLISASVLENIFLNNHWVTTISTNPNGVLVSDNILNNASLKVPAYNFSERVINLGYLPGNYLGIQSFLANPQNTAPYDINKHKVWSETHLSNLKSIADFDLFILITDNTDNAKLWIEQIELMHPEIGFIVISTTQSTPLLKPYINSNQIDGMLGGITGGFAFSLLDKSDTTEFNRYWNLSQISVSVIIMFLLLGTAVTIISKMKQFIPNKKKK